MSFFQRIKMLLMFVLVLNMLEIHFHMVHYERSRKLHQYKFLSFFMHILKIQHKFHAFHALFAYFIKRFLSFLYQLYRNIVVLPGVWVLFSYNWGTISSWKFYGKFDIKCLQKQSKKYFANLNSFTPHWLRMFKNPEQKLQSSDMAKWMQRCVPNITYQFHDTRGNL